MNYLNILATRLTLAAAAAVCLVSIAAAKPAEAPDTIAGQWIVELQAPPTAVFEGGPMIDRSGNRAVTREMEATAPAVTGSDKLDVQSRAVIEYVEYLDDQRNAVLAEAAGLLGRSVAPRHVYHHTFNGFSVSMDAEAAKRLEEIPGVKSVEPDTIHRMQLDAGPRLIGANLVWSGFGGLESSRGEGMVIGVIDSGINWDHPYFDPASSGGHTYSNPLGQQLGECSKPSVPCTDKLVGVYDFTVEGTDGFDPVGHGSHVASIAAGHPLNYSLSGLPFQTSGVAPWASIVSYKVCYLEHPTDPSLNDVCETSAILDAIDQAVIDGIDVVNYSLGGNAPNPWSNSVALALRNLRAVGTLPVTSAGNSGPGPSTIASPANAPWTVAVGNTSHNRIWGYFVDVAGATNIPVVPAPGPWPEATFSTPVMDVAAEFPGNSLACTTFPQGAFSGQIAFVDRGGCPPIFKVSNLAAAGASAVLVAQNVSGGRPLEMDLGGAGIPAAMMTKSHGQSVRSAIAASGNPTAELRSTRTSALNDVWGDQVAESSARGPAPGLPGVMKPDFTAPGVQIVGATSPADNQVMFSTGTSMSSPHAAGAAILLKALNPNWDPATLHSALVTTATASPVTYEGEPAGFDARGAGSIRVNQAARAGLMLPVSEQQFINANPDIGGNPAELNLPGIVVENCVEDCEFTRIVRALAPGTWTVSTEGSDLDIQVEPSEFILAPFETRELTITVSRETMATGEWISGSVVLIPESSSFVPQRLPVGLFASPGSVPVTWNVDADRNRGEDSVTMNQLGELPEAVFRTSALVKPDRTVVSLAQDPSPDNPFSGGTGTHSFLIDVPVDTLKIYSETLESTANDIDLFIGLDINGNGQPDEAELACFSISLDELETCEIDQPVAGSWWVLIQNWEASSPSASDDVTLDVAVLTAGNDPSFTAYGPGKHDGGPLTIPVFWDQPAMGLNERWMAALAVSTSPDHLANVGVTRMNVTRGSLNLPQNTVLFNGEPRPVHLPQNNVHDKLYIDVPPGASALEVDIDGPVIDASLRRRDFEDMDGFEPNTPPAPDEVITSGNNNGSGLTLNLSGGIPAGRYYVVLDNDSGSEEMVTVTATYTEASRNALVRGLYSPALRSTGQGIEWNGGADDNAYILWYTYDDDGVPVFYITDLAAVSDDSSFWTTEILRATTGDGVRQTLTGAGEAGITALDGENLIYSWRYNGRHGSEWLDLVTVNRCAEIEGQSQHLLATWTIQGAREGGASVLINDFTEAWIRYYFDALGVGRWVQHATVDETPPNSGSHNTAVNEMSVLDFRGFCPYCDDTGFGYQVVGTVEREFFDELSGLESVEFTSRPPLNQDYSATRTMGRLSQVLGCQ